MSDEKVKYAHDAQDLDERRRAALAASDNAGFSYVAHCIFDLLSNNQFPSHSWFYVKIVLVASVCFFTDACVFHIFEFLYVSSNIT